MRSVHVAIALLTMCIAGLPLGFVQAQTNPTGTSTGTGGASGSANPGAPVKADFLMRLLRKKENGEWSVFSDFEQKYYFNNARCQCGTQIRLELYFSAQGAAKKTLFTQRKDTIRVLIGEAACVANSATARSGAACKTVADLTLGAFARSASRPTFDFPVSWLFGRTFGACGEQGQQAIRLAIDTNGDQNPDLSDDAAPTLSVDFDGQPPSPPDRESIKVSPGNEALEVSWQQSQGVADFRGYTVFCSRGELSVFKNSPYDGQFHTPATECPGKVVSQSLSQADGWPLRQALAVVAPEDNAGNIDAAASDDAGTESSSASRGVEFAAPDPFRTLNPAYVCSDLLRTQRSARITGLQNNIPYLVGVATLDLNGNASPITSVLLQRPIPTQDFFAGYKGAGGDASGGFCSVGGRGRIGVASLLVWAMVALVFRGIARRRRKR